MAPSLSSTSDDTWSDTTYDDVPSEFFTFATPLSDRGSGILVGYESTSSIPDLIRQGKHSCGLRESNSPNWVPLAIGSPEAPLPFGISVPESPYNSSSNGDCDTSFTDSLRGSLAQRRRPAEYFHRPPVWRIQPLKADNGLSSSGSDSGTNITSDIGITNHLDTCQFCTTVQRKNSPTKKSVSDFRGWFDSQVPSRFFKGFRGYDEKLNSMASTWAEEPLVVGMASIPDFDVKWMNEDEGSTSQSKDKGKARDDSQYESSPSALKSSLPSEGKGKGKATEELQSSSSSSPLRRAQPSKDKGLAWDKLQSTSSSAPLKRTSQFKGKGKDISQYQPSSSSPQGFSQNAPESNSPFYIESDSDHGERHRALRLPDPDCETRTEDCTKPACKTSVPGSNIPEDNQANVDANVSDADFVSIHSDLARTGSERRASGKQNRPAGAKDQHTTIDPQSSTTASPSRIMKSNIPQEWSLFKQEGVFAERILDIYKDIRVTPCQDGGSYGIKRGSRVICIGDTNVGSTAEDEYCLEVGDAFIVLLMYGDLWASCLKLSLTDPVTTVPAASSTRLTIKRDYAWPKNPKSIKFLPLCSVTLEENFGEYIRRRQNLNPDSNNTLSADPCNGQRVDPPKRKQSQQASNYTLKRREGDILIPGWMANECTKIHKMPDGKLGIPKNDTDAPDYGHVDEPTTRPTLYSKTGTDGQEKSRFFRRLQIEDKLTAKNGKILGVGRMKRTQSSTDCEPLMGNSNSTCQVATRENPDAETATKDASMPNPVRATADTGRKRDSNIFSEGLGSPSGVGGNSPHITTSQVASNQPNPPEALASLSTQTEVRDFAPGGAAPGGTALGEASPDDGARGDGGQSNPSGASPSNSDTGGHTETVIISREEHKEAFAVADQAAPNIGSQPYVTVGEIPAEEAPKPNKGLTIPVRTTSEVRRQNSTLKSNRRSFFKHFPGIAPFKRRTQSDFGP